MNIHSRRGQVLGLAMLLCHRDIVHRSNLSRKYAGSSVRLTGCSARVPAYDPSTKFSPLFKITTLRNHHLAKPKERINVNWSTPPLVSLRKLYYCASRNIKILDDYPVRAGRANAYLLRLANVIESKPPHRDSNARQSAEQCSPIYGDSEFAGASGLLARGYFRLADKDLLHGRSPPLFHRFAANRRSRPSRFRRVFPKRACLEAVCKKIKPQIFTCSRRVGNPTPYREVHE